MRQDREKAERSREEQEEKCVEGSSLQQRFPPSNPNLPLKAGRHRCTREGGKNS